MPTRRRFILSAAATVAAVPALGAAAAAAPSIVAGKGTLTFKVGDAILTTYAHDDKVVKPYFFPVNAPSGKCITRPWPMIDEKGEEKDHVHHKSAWFCHGDVIPDGVTFKKHFREVEGVDFWSERKGHGRIVCTKVAEPVNTATEAKVATLNEWRTDEGTKILTESRTLTLRPTAAGGSLIVLDIDFHADVCGITFGDTKEGSLGIRVRQSVRMDKGKGTMVNAEGKTGEGRLNNIDKSGCWGIVSNWVDYSGPVGDAVAGIAVFASPGNPVDTAWHARNYGLLAANPFGREKHAKFPDRKGNNKLVKIEKGGHLRLKYALYVHAGDVKAGKVAEAYKEFAG